MSRASMVRKAAAAVTAVLVTTTVTGCGPELRDVPMPGLVSGDTYELTAQFESALNLPLDSPVKLNGSTVGQVTDITVKDFTALVTMKVVTTVQVHKGVHAEIRLTAPMGIAFVELVDPTPRAPVVMPDSTIGLASTNRAPDIGDLLTSLSVVVTGGPFADLKIIVDELNKALAGNGPRIHVLLERLVTTVSDLNAHTNDFDASLRAIDQLTTQLAADTPVLFDAVEEIRPAVRLLTQQQASYMELLAQIRKLGRHGTSLLRSSRADIVTAVSSLDTVLASLNSTQESMVPFVHWLHEFAIGGDLVSPGDFVNFDLKITLDPAEQIPTSGEIPGNPTGNVKKHHHKGLLPHLGIPAVDDTVDDAMDLLNLMLSPFGRSAHWEVSDGS